MQACIYETYGPPEVVTVAEVEKPEPRSRELLVRVHASAVTSADWRFRASEFPKPFWLAGRLMLGLWRPRNPILGMDFSGVVEAVGKGVTQYAVGDAVFGSTAVNARGAHAQYLTAAETGAILRKPECLTHFEAAALPFGANAALAFMRDVANVRPGQRVLIIGGSGAVGAYAVQLAHHFGAHVTAVCSQRNGDWVRSLGADQVADYHRETFPGGATYDVIFDTIGVTTFDAARTSLTENGVYVPLNGHIFDLLRANFSGRSGKRVKTSISKNTTAALAENCQLIADGHLRPVVDRIYPMHQIADAHRHVESRHKRGTVVVSMA